SWHSAAAWGDNLNGPPSRFPSLSLAEKEDDGREFPSGLARIVVESFLETFAGLNRNLR
ncbi:hypothetical protein Tco_1131441, partial [Tanacetum coccineum]